MLLLCMPCSTISLRKFERDLLTPTQINSTWRRGNLRAMSVRQHGIAQEQIHMLYCLLQVLMRTLADCKLGVSIYPILEYDASSGGGVAEVTDEGYAPVHSIMQSVAVAVNIACSRPARLWPVAEISAVPRRRDCRRQCIAAAVCRPPCIAFCCSSNERLPWLGSHSEML